MNLTLRQKRLLDALMPGNGNPPKTRRSITVAQARDKRQAAIIAARRLLGKVPSDRPSSLLQRLRDRLKAFWLARAAAPAQKHRPFSPGVSSAHAYGWVPHTFGERCPVSQNNPNHQCQHCAGNGLGDGGQKERA